MIDTERDKPSAASVARSLGEAYLGLLRSLLGLLAFLAAAAAAAAIIVLPTWLFATRAPTAYALVVAGGFFAAIGVSLVRRQRRPPRGRRHSHGGRRLLLAMASAVLGLFALILSTRGAVAVAVPVAVAFIAVLGLALVSGRRRS